MCWLLYPTLDSLAQLRNKFWRMTMRVIDWDAHVEESIETWQYLDREFYLLRPIPVVFPEDTCRGTHNAARVIDYKLRFFASNPTLMKRAHGKDASIPVQEMRDVNERIACMDALAIDIQVVFPSIWLGCLAENVELEAALARSYNQFMATQCNRSGGRMWYVAILPWRPYILSKLGDDFIVTATDFPHGDAFRQDQLAWG